MNAYSQGTNNDFDFDKEDLSFIFSKLGYTAFKFPIKQKSNEYIDFVIEEYIDGKLSKRNSLVQTSKKAFSDLGIDPLKYIKPAMDSLQEDSIYLHRFYIQKSDTIIEINIKTHGLSSPFKYNIAQLGRSNVRATNAINEEIKKKEYLNIMGEKILIFCYANKKGDEVLWCPSGLPKEMIIDRYYYCLFIIAKPYKDL